MFVSCAGQQQKYLTPAIMIFNCLSMVSSFTTWKHALSHNKEGICNLWHKGMWELGATLPAAAATDFFFEAQRVPGPRSSWASDSFCSCDKKAPSTEWACSVETISVCKLQPFQREPASFRASLSLESLLFQAAQAPTLPLSSYNMWLIKIIGPHSDMMPSLRQITCLKGKQRHLEEH